MPGMGRECLRLLAEIDDMIALRDVACRRDSVKCRYAAQLMDASIDLARHRLRQLGSALPGWPAPRRLN